MSMTETDAEVNNADVTSTKAMLEREKLRLEIEQLKQPWWRKPTYILAGLPTLLALVTLIYGFANGYFQAAAIKLENQRHDLEGEIKEFTQRKEELEHQNLLLREELEGVIQFIKKERRVEKELLGEIQTLKKSLAVMLESQENLKASEKTYLEALKKENEQLKKENQRLKIRR